MFESRKHEELKETLEKLKALEKLNIYPPTKKEQAEEILFEFLNFLKVDTESKKLIDEFIEHFENIKSNY
jgi:hypothetical protein